MTSKIDWATFWAVLLAVFIVFILHGLFSPLLLRVGNAMHGHNADGTQGSAGGQ